MADTQDDLTKRARALLDCVEYDKYGKPLEDSIQHAARVLQSEREAEREKVAAFMLRNSIATGHGDTTDDLLTELQGHLSEREAAAAEARRAALEEAAVDCMEWYATTGNKDCRYAYKNAAVSIRALPSAPAPQEER